MNAISFFIKNIEIAIWIGWNLAFYMVLTPLLEW
jgi:hypothetical protein